MANKKVPHFRTDMPGDSVVKAVEIHPAVKFVKEQWDSFDTHWSDKFSKFDQYYDRWKGKPTKRDEDWQSDFNKKLTWQAVSTLVSRFHSGLWPTSAPIATETPETEDELPSIASHSLVSHWFKIGRFSMEFLKGMRSAAVYGTGLFEDDWFQDVKSLPFKEEVQVPVFKPMFDEFGQPVLNEVGGVQSIQVGTRPTMREGTRMTVVEDRYRVRKASIFSWRIHPSKLTDEDDFPVIKQEFITMEDLEKRELQLQKYGLGVFENMEEIRKDNFKIDQTQAKRLEKDSGYVDKKNPRLEILNYWGLYSENDKEKKPSWLMIVNRKWKLKVVDNPFWHKKPPLFHIVWTEDAKESYYGIGVSEAGAPAEDRANSVVNIRTDERRKNVKGGGWYNAGDKRINKKSVSRTVPGLYKACTDVNNAVRPDQIIPSTPDDYKEEENAVNDHREITGSSASLLPSADQSQVPDTLGGMKLQLGASLQRLKPDLVMMEFMGIRKMANRAFLLTRQFYTEAEAVELIASQDQKTKFQLQKVYRVQPEQIMEKLNFHSTGLSETLDKSQDIDKLIKYAEVTSKIPAMQAVTNYQGIGKKVALLLGFEDVEDLVLMNPNNPLAPMPQQQGAPGLPGGQIPGAGGGLPPNILQNIASGIGSPRAV